MLSASTKRLIRLTALLVPLVLLSLVVVTRKVQTVRRKLDRQHELERVSEVLLGWVKANKGAVGDVKLEYFDHKQSRDPVRGIMATADIREGTQVLKIPHKLLFVPPLNYDLKEQEFDLAVRVAEQLQKVRQGEASSEHAVYFKTLPTTAQLETFHPMYADNADLALFSDLSVVKAVRQARNTLKGMWEKSKKGGGGFGGSHSWTEFLTAFVLQNSRRFVARISDPSHKADRHQTLCLVPLLDMLNFPDKQGGDNVGWVWDADEDAVLVRATKFIPAGGELLLHPFQMEERLKHNGLLAYQYGVSLKDNDVAIDQLPNDICEGMESAVDELRADKDRKHWMRTVLAELTHESCAAIHAAREQEKERKFLEAEQKRTQLLTASVR